MERAIDQSELQPTRASECAAFVDIAVPLRPQLLRLVLSGSIVCGAATAVSELLSFPKAIEYLLFGLSLFAGFILHDRLIARRARRALQSAASGTGNTSIDWREGIRQWAIRAGGASPIAVALLPRRAAIADAAQFVADRLDPPRLVRLTPTTGAAPALPAGLTERIEPTLLRSSDPVFWETFSSVSRPTTARRLAAILRAYGRRIVSQVFVIVSFGLAALGFVVIGIETVRGLLRGAAPPILVQFGGISAGGAIFFLAPRWRPSTWFAMHGGLLIAETVWHRTSRDLQRFTPADSVLLYWPETRQLAVARRGGTSYARLVQPPEAEAAIAAWLSPLPCPPLERFSDLR